MSAMTPIQQLLLDCMHQDHARLTEDRLVALDEMGWRELFNLARIMRVRPLVLERLSKGGFKSLVPTTPWNELNQQCRQIAMTALRQQAELVAIVTDLAARQIPVIVLKGAYLRDAVYQNHALREMGDLDIMVRHEHLQQAADVVAARGYTSLKSGPVDVNVDAAVAHHLPRCIKRGVTAAEVHWNLTTSREPYAINPADLWLRPVPFRVGSITALALSPEDLVLHICLHASYQHEFAFGVRSLCDLEAVIRGYGTRIDWGAVRDRAVTWKWAPGVHAMLRLARDLVGAAVPGSVISSLRPANWREDMLETAREQLLADPSELIVLGAEVARLSGSESMGTRLKHLYRRICLSPDYLASQFSVPLDSSRWVFACLRLRRFGDLLNRYGRIVARVHIGQDRRLAIIADRKNALRKWLLAP
jgi:hypothetical protein